MSLLRKLGQLSLADIIFVLAERMGLPILNWNIDKLNRLISKHSTPMNTFAHGLRILYGPTFPTWGASALVDKALSTILRLRGANVIALYCDSVQIGPCSVADDRWLREPFSKECLKCRKNSEILWRGFEAIRFSEFTSTMEVLNELKVARTMTVGEIESYSESGLGLGDLARKLTLNGLLLEKPDNTLEYQTRLEIHFANLKASRKAIRGALEKTKPDRVVSSDSHYGMWAIMQHEATALGIPFYSQYPVTSERTSFASNKPAVWADLTEAFKTFQDRDLDHFEKSQFSKRFGGNDTLKSTGRRRRSPLDKVPKSDGGSALMMTNAPWDLASLDRQAVFPDMFSWVRETVNWFCLHPHFTLYIRTHPVERNALIPRSSVTVEEMIKREFKDLPDNIVLISGQLDKLSLGTIINHLNPSVALVHTSTSGLDCAIKGVKVITTGFSPYRDFGFTSDPKTEVEYIEQLEARLRTREGLSKFELDRAKKFISYYQFRYQSNTFIQTKLPARVSPNFKSSLQDEKSALSYVVNTIVTGGSFHTSERWAPNYPSDSRG